MFNGAKITSNLLKSLQEDLEESKLNVIRTHRIFQVVPSEYPTCLYDYLELKGYKNPEYVLRWIDRISEKYKIFRYFHKPKYYVAKRSLYKGSLRVYFDDWNVMVFKNGETIADFDKRATTKEILNFIKQEEREIKLERLLK